MHSCIRAQPHSYLGLAYVTKVHSLKLVWKLTSPRTLAIFQR